MIGKEGTEAYVFITAGSCRMVSQNAATEVRWLVGNEHLAAIWD